MKGTQKIAQNNSGTRVKQNKSSKQNKENKNSAEQNSEDPDSTKPQEKGSKPKSKPSEKSRGARKTNDTDKNSNHEPTDKTGMKKKQSEKRKQEGNEWKALKRIDYQRLETVVEEGQLSSEESTMKPPCSEDLNRSDPGIANHGHGKKKKLKMCNIVSAAKQPKKKLEAAKDDIGNKTITVEGKESCGEPAEPDSKVQQLKKNLSLNGMMEILPIFSNDKFVCSRDAISIEEYEDLESLEKNLSQSANSVKKEAPSVQDREEKVVGKLAESKEFTERKLRYKMLTDINFTQRSSSHFINSLLVLKPFAADARLLNGINSFNDTVEKENYSFQIQRTPGDVSCELKTIPAIIFTTIGVFFVCIALAWKSYEPPRLIDYILEFIPFLHRRRTFVQLFFDQIIKIVSNVFKGSCKNKAF